MPDVNLDNSDKRLISGVVRLCRDNISGWSTSSEYGIPNVWPQSPPTSVEEEFPRGVVDIISSEDTELSVDLDVKLREVILRVTVFAESSDDVYTLTDGVDNAIPEYWDSLDGEGEQYIGDWTFNSLDGSAETNETGETEGKLRYARYKDFRFETVRVN